MFKIIKIIIFFLYIYSYFSNSYSSEKLIEELKEGEKIVLIRHALAPGSGDPINFNLNDCSTQRNLNIKGIEQSKKIGSFFTKNNILIDQVLSSEWCRCKDTAKYAFQNFKTFNALNSFYDVRFAANEAKQIKDLKDYIKKWDDDKNLVFVTHFVVISSILNIGSSSGEIIIADKNLNIIGSINTM